jgi:hypothetical protein
VNTVRAVYRELEEHGLIDTRHGAGSFVSESAQGSPEVERIAADALAAAQDAGVDPRDLAIVALVAASLPELPEEILEADIALNLGEQEDQPPPQLTPEELASELELDDSWLEADDVGARRELRRQIGVLEAQLASYRREVGTPSDPPLLNPPEPRIAGAEELERTRDALLAQLTAARNTASERARRERRARAVRDAIVADPAGHRWEVVSATETGEEGCTTWQAEPRFGPLGALMSWWRVKVSGGCPLCPSQP